MIEAAVAETVEAEAVVIEAAMTEAVEAVFKVSFKALICQHSLSLALVFRLKT